MSMIYVLIDDKKKNPYPKTFYKKDEELFKKLNNGWWWIYWTVNEFEASEDEMKQAWVKTMRNIQFLKKLRFVFADLDIAKSWEWMTREEKQSRKQKLINALNDKCKSTMIIDTSNWIQPLWKLKPCWTDKDIQKLYVNTINWIIEWSKSHWAMWDQVKDVTRVIRMIWYYHMKEEPYLCNIIEDSYDKNNERLFDLNELSQIFPFETKSYETKTYQSKTAWFTTWSTTNISHQLNRFHLNPISQAIEEIDFKELVIRAFASNSRTATFDEKWRLILDWRLTWTFLWKNWNQDYLASTSHEPFTWNRITVVSWILSVNNKEAREWIVKEYNLSFKTVEISKKAEEILKDLDFNFETSDSSLSQSNSIQPNSIPSDQIISKELVLYNSNSSTNKANFKDIEDVEIINEANKDFSKNKTRKVENEYQFKWNKDYYTWWTETLTDNFAPIKKNSYIIIAWESWAGKTTYTFDLAIKNSELWHLVLYFNLEMETEDIYENICNNYAKINIKETVRKIIPQYKQNLFNEKMQKLKLLKNLKILWFRRWASDCTWKLIEIILKNAIKDSNWALDMIFIDNLDLIQWEKWEDDNTRTRNISKNIMSFTVENKVPVILIHHYRKSLWMKNKTWIRWLDDIRWSGKLTHDADIVLQVVRTTDPNASEIEKIRTTLIIHKARWFQKSIKNVYFDWWTFVDDIPDYLMKKANIQYTKNYYETDD